MPRPYVCVCMQRGTKLPWEKLPWEETCPTCVWASEHWLRRACSSPSRRTTLLRLLFSWNRSAANHHLPTIPADLTTKEIEQILGKVLSYIIQASTFPLDLFYFVNFTSSCLLIPLQLTDSKLGSDELQHTPLAPTSVNREFSPKCIRSAHSICCTVLQRWTATKHVMCASLCGRKVYLVPYQCCIDSQVSSRGLPQKKEKNDKKYGVASMQKASQSSKKVKGSQRGNFVNKVYQTNARKTSKALQLLHQQAEARRKWSSTSYNRKTAKFYVY